MRRRFKINEDVVIILENRLSLIEIKQFHGRKGKITKIEGGPSFSEDDTFMDIHENQKIFWVRFKEQFNINITMLYRQVQIDEGQPVTWFFQHELRHPKEAVIDLL